MTDRDRETLEQAVFALCRTVTGGREHLDVIQCLANIGAEHSSLLKRLEAAEQAAEKKGNSVDYVIRNATRIHELEERLEAAEREIAWWNASSDTGRIIRERDAWMSSSKDHHDEAKELRERLTYYETPHPCPICTPIHEENERLRVDQTDWRKGVELIASALGEHSPPNLDCVRISRLALEQEARIDAALALHTVDNEFGWCPECYDRNAIRDKGPCPTVKALKGEGEGE